MRKGTHQTPEARDRIGKAQVGRTNSPIRNQKISDTLEGVPLTDAQLASRITVQSIAARAHIARGMRRYYRSLTPAQQQAYIKHWRGK